MRRLHYQQIMVIVHGKSEFQMCKNFQSNLRIPMRIYAHCNGRSSIQITALNGILNKSNFRSYKAFTKEFPKIEAKNQRLKNFRLFIIMDTDDCTQAEKEAFKDKSMFSEHWLYPYIYPIYNSPNLEETMSHIGIYVKDKSQYNIYFPVNHGEFNLEEMRNLAQKLRSCPFSNLHDFVVHCIEIAKNNMVKK